MQPAERNSIAASSPAHSDPTAHGGRDNRAWRHAVERYQRPSTKRALWQLTNTFVPYVLLWWGMYLLLEVSVGLAALLAVVAAAFLVRIFIIFHDCTHGSYFRSRRANEIVGFIAGVLTFSPFRHWRWEHAMHHAGAGNLDRRGLGDIWTMTVQEYLSASRWRRLHYRLVRNPVVLFALAPLFVFAVKQRFASPKAHKRERRSVLSMNLVLLGVATLFSWTLGVIPFLLLQSIVLAVAGAVGLWLFYVQHQFEGVYWERGDNWDHAAAALRGSSYYKLPKVLQWLSGNIGFHHIHHLSPRIPNYNLQRCHESDPMFQDVTTITLISSLRSLRCRFWDEQGGKLVGYSHLRRIATEPRSDAALLSGGKE